MKTTSTSVADFTNLYNASKLAFENLAVFDETISPDLQAALDATDKWVKIIATGGLKQFEQDETKVEEIKKNLQKAIPHGRFTKQTWKTITFLSTNLSACTCHDNVNRIARVSFAHNLKSEFIINLNKDSITIGTIGPGHCLLEFTIQAIAKKTIHWILVEPKLKDTSSSAYKATQEFKNLVQFLSPTSTVEECGEGIEGYMGKIESGTKKLPDIFMAVDLKKKIFDLHMSRVKDSLEKGKDHNNPRCLAIMTPDYPATFTTY